MKNKVFNQILRAIGVMCYFIILNFAYTRMNLERLVGDIEVFAGVYLVLGIIELERAYKNDSGQMTLTAIELIVMAFHSISIMHIISAYKYDFRTYLVVSSYAIAIYYVLKSIVIYTKSRRKFLKKLSDIPEIVKEEPIKKEAKKRKKDVPNKENKENKEKKENKENKEKKEKKESKESKESKEKKKNKESKENKKEKKVKEND